MKGLFVLFIAITVAAAASVHSAKNCPKNPACPTIDGMGPATYLPDKENCHKFYECSAGRACPKECPTYDDNEGQLVYNQELQVCDWPENVPNAVCSDATLTPKNTGTEDEPKDTTSEEEPKDTKTVVKRSEKAPLFERGKCPVKGWTRVPHENQCNLYYDCNNGVRSAVRQCPENMVFNPYIEACDFPLNVDCNAIMNEKL